MANINQIHNKQLAIKGRIYEENGKFYVGQPNGSLKVEEYLGGDLQGTTLRSEVIRVGDYTTEELMDLLDEISKDIADLEDEDVNVEVNSVTLVDTDNTYTDSILKDILIELKINNKLLSEAFNIEVTKRDLH